MLKLMAKIAFRKIKMNKANKERLATINSIVEDYQRQGFKLTLRQLYYQLVSRDIIPNQQKEYDKLSRILKEGRMAGIVDWDAIEDRLRVPSKPPSFDGPEDILNTAIIQYALDRQEGQDHYLEVRVEKDALSGVLSRVTRQYHIPILVCRGYSSTTAMYDAYIRFDRARSRGQRINILYIGDFDPSGEDMVRDIEDRIMEFANGDDPENFDFMIDKITLTKPQIRQYKPPPNPAKRKDPRAKDFIAAHGDQSWEVDALRPEVLNDILTKSIHKLIDLTMYDDILKQEGHDKLKLKGLSKHL